MRPARTLLGTAVALALVWPAHGESLPLPAAVLTDGAEVRCKPGTEPAVYVTQKLPRGTTVRVVERMSNGWLKIEPDLPGAFSLVNTRYLRQANYGMAGVWVVSAENPPVTTLVGSWLLPREERPNVVGTTLARGAQVIAVGAVLPQKDGDWLPILPPPGEYRYMLAKDVSGPPGGSSPAPPTTSARPGGTAAPATAGLPGLPPVATDSPPQSREILVPAPQPAGDPLLEKAQQLERSGDKRGAADIYDQLGRNYFSPNHDAAVQYYNRAAWLRGGSTAAAPAPVTEGDAVYQRARQAEQAGNWPEAIRNYTRLGDLYRGEYISNQYYNRANWLKQRHPEAAAAPGTSATTTPPASQPPAVVQSRAISLQEAGPGRVVSARMPIDGRPTYVLESAQATVLAYLTPQPGVDLERYVGQNVRVLGDSAQRSDLTVPYMKLTRVVPLASSP